MLTMPGFFSGNSGCFMKSGLIVAEQCLQPSTGQLEWRSICEIQTHLRLLGESVVLKYRPRFAIHRELACENVLVVTRLSHVRGENDA